MCLKNCPLMSSSTYGCNIWGSSSTLYNTNLSPITELAAEVNGTKYALPTTEAELNTYLNTTYYDGLNQAAKEMVKEDALYNVGVLKNQSGQTISTDINQVNAVKWKGKVGLIDATEYLRASTNSSCTSVYQGYQTSAPCKNNNWKFNSDYWWTMSPYSESGSYIVWDVTSSGYIGNHHGFYVHTSSGVRPVVTLSPEVKITGGDGSSDNSYTLSI